MIGDPKTNEWTDDRTWHDILEVLGEDGLMEKSPIAVIIT
jgi:hypothetical protein